MSCAFTDSLVASTYSCRPSTTSDLYLTSQPLIMASNNLPSREDYIANHLLETDICRICTSAFDEEHVSARLAGPHGCNHVFGSECIKTWLRSAGESANINRFPMCRTLFFRSSGNTNGDDQNNQSQPQVISSPPLHEQIQNRPMIVESFDNLECLNFAYLLMKYIADSFECEHGHIDTIFSDEFIRELVMPVQNCLW